MTHFDGHDQDGASSREEGLERTGLDPELAPPEGSEERLVSALAVRGLLVRNEIPRSRFFSVGLLAAAAALVVFAFAAGLAAGFFAGRRAQEPLSGSPRFVLFLFGEPTVTAETERDRVAEYKRWAAGVARGRFVAGERLGLGGRHLGLAASDPRRLEGADLRGYFVIEAPDLAHATEVARTCPHLLHGGRILVRPIDPV
jgi:hypothetical protein